MNENKSYNPKLNLLNVVTGRHVELGPSDANQEHVAGLKRDARIVEGRLQIFERN